jgi:hypothetical protein
MINNKKNDWCPREEVECGVETEMWMILKRDGETSDRITKNQGEWKEGD